VPLRSQGIPLVPNGVDAFLFLDREHIFSGESSHKQKRRPRPVLRGASVTEAVAAWQHAGWQIRPIAMVERSPFVGAARLTTKTLKFAVGASFAELLDDRDWVVAVDYNMYIDLSKLASFLGQYEGQAPLLLLDWRHWPGNYSLSGTECLLREMRTMLFKWKGYIKGSRRNCESWMRKMQREHDAGLLLPDYYDLTILFRNLRHPRSPDVTKVFERMVEHSREIERDQWLMPYYLWQQRLVSSVSLVTEKELKSRIGFCEIGHNPTYRSAGNSSDMCRDPCNGYVCPAGWSTAAGRSDRCRCSCRRRDQQGSRASGQAAPLSRASITSVPAQPNQPHIHAPSASAPAAALCPAQLPCNRRFACPPGFIVTARQDDPCKCKCALPGELARYGAGHNRTAT